MRVASTTKTITKLILTKIGELGLTTLNGFFPAQYPEARVWRRLLGLDDSYEFSKRNFSKILWKLKTQGFVKSNGLKRNAEWMLTSKGRDVLSNNLKIMQKRDGIRRIIIFDIPERERGKRNWLRLELISLGYEPLQKSVWKGETPFPKTFFESLDALELGEHVQLFVVREYGRLI